MTWPGPQGHPTNWVKPAKFTTEKPSADADYKRRWEALTLLEDRPETMEEYPYAY